MYLVLAILIKEDFERPKIIRYFETLLNTKTRNIAQNDSVDDSNSVFILVQKCINYFENNKSDIKREVKRFAMEINNSNEFANDVFELYQAISELDDKYYLVDSSKARN